MKFLYKISFEVKNKVPTGNWTHCKIQKYTFLVRRCKMWGKEKEHLTELKRINFKLKVRDKSKALVLIKNYGIIENRSVQNWMPHNQKALLLKTDFPVLFKCSTKIIFSLFSLPVFMELGSCAKKYIQLNKWEN